MKRKPVLAIVLVLSVAFLAAVLGLVSRHASPILNPQGTIAEQEKHLMIVATLLMLVVVVPVFILTFGIAWRYRADNLKPVYAPEWDNNPWAESVWWGIPCLIIGILAVITWNSSHVLDPSQALASSNQPITIQVVALQWKWLFIYPGQHIATTNYVEFPENTPVHFEITADAPMNSFWIPQLGSQIYAMPGMTTQLNLMADTAGQYAGSSANLSGAGFAHMQFTAISTTAPGFDAWVTAAKKSTSHLNAAEYTNLEQPSEDTPQASYTLATPDLYDQIMMKFMMPNSPIHD